MYWKELARAKPTWKKKHARCPPPSLSLPPPRATNHSADALEERMASRGQWATAALRRFRTRTLRRARPCRLNEYDIAAGKSATKPKGLVGTAMKKNA